MLGTLQDFMLVGPSRLRDHAEMEQNLHVFRLDDSSAFKIVKMRYSLLGRPFTGIRTSEFRLEGMWESGLRALYRFHSSWLGLGKKVRGPLTTADVNPSITKHCLSSAGRPSAYHDEAC